MVCKVLTTLASGVGVRHPERGGHALGEVQWVGYVYEDLAVKVLLASLLERLQRYGAGRGVDDHLAVGGCITESAELHLGVLLLPGTEWGDCHIGQDRCGRASLAGRGCRPSRHDPGPPSGWSSSCRPRLCRACRISFVSI